MGRHRGKYAEEPSGGRRGRRGRGGAIATLAGALVIVLAIVVAGVYILIDRSDGCGSQLDLDVAVAPEMTPPVQTVADEFNAEEHTVDGDCVRVDVRQADPADVAYSMTGAGATMGDTESHVWIPDSSVWPRQVQNEAGDAIITETGTSLARTPLVPAELAEFADDSQESTWEDVAPTGTPGEGQDRTVRVVDPVRSSTGLGTLYLLHGTLQESSSDADTFNTQMTAALQSLHQGASADEEAAFLALSGGSEESPPLMVMSEQAVWRYNNLHSEAPARAGYMDSTYYLDYPYVVRSEESAITRAAEEFRNAVRAEENQEYFLKEGFRDTDDDMDPEVLAADAGFREEVPEELPVPSGGTVEELTRSWNQLKMDSRVLTIVDVSGSMLAEVPGTGMSRIQVTGAAADDGLDMFTPSSELGLWEFSTDVNDGLHHQELAPVRELQASGEDGTDHREVMAQELESLQPRPDGDTAMYETYLAAYEEMSRTYRPDRTNVILMLTDGDNDHPGGMELQELLDGIDELSSPSRPIPIITIAFGPDVQHLEPLQEIAAATGGAAYMTEDPRDIGEIFVQAFSLRIDDDGGEDGGS
ncbi:substrate-binding domain-containing protein [Nocardiopsis xinjiangensis]|uniref:substrate-binding domain-containing protein n=1 Tax=Nocardiopsis xinjiangensis TaxID=124285 RepID=UPI000345D569|nr:substrate-binding domain-containing protein [Nocardiopsis xinjiangensis]